MEARNKEQKKQHCASPMVASWGIEEAVVCVKSMLQERERIDAREGR